MNNLSLLDDFRKFCSDNGLASKRKRTLLAVSGGKDSIAMAHLFFSSGYPFAIAHCNFGLRGEESDADEVFVKNLSQQWGISFYSARFDTAEYARENAVSIQVAARNLRYTWFEKLFTEAANSNLAFANIATAHHLNDSIETILLNLTRGTGIKGLRGIPVRNGHIVRPLLFATREEIDDYVLLNKINYREDSSNAEDKYARNKIRHHVIPVLKKLNPSFEESISRKIEVFSELEELYEQKHRKLHQSLFTERDGDIYIPILKLRKLKYPRSVLFDKLNLFGFNAAQIDDMLMHIDGQPGKQFFSATHRILRDREFFILSTLAQKSEGIVVVNEPHGNLSYGNVQFNIDIVENESLKLNSNTDTALLDSSKIGFPILIRKWRAGDYFYPYGMGMKKKKLKKFFTDLKIPLHVKEELLVVESNRRIIWVCGHRIDERFKVTPNTRQVLKISMKTLA